MLTDFSIIRYGYASRIMILPMAAILFCLVTFYTSPLRSQDIKVAKKPLTIVVDAAHGGIDKGAQAENGITEKEIALEIQKKIKELSPGL